MKLQWLTMIVLTTVSCSSCGDLVRTGKLKNPAPREAKITDANGSICSNFMGVWEKSCEVESFPSRYEIAQTSCQEFSINKILYSLTPGTFLNYQVQASWVGDDLRVEKIEPDSSESWLFSLDDEVLSLSVNSQQRTCSYRYLSAF